MQSIFYVTIPMKILKDIKNINAYILNPKHNIDIHYSSKEKWRILFNCLVYDIIILIFLVYPILIGIDRYIVPFVSSNIIDKSSLIDISLYFIIIAPIFEELIFRLPLKYEHNYLFNVIQNIINKESNTLEKFWITYFKPIFYLFSFGFALVHITNYENNQTIFYLLAPLIVLSQGIGGLILGYVRMHLGLKWAILNHALFNFIIIILIPMLFSHNSLVLENKNDTIDLKIQLIEFYDKQEKNKLTLMKTR